jgi:hypothetical protein
VLFPRLKLLSFHSGHALSSRIELAVNLQEILLMKWIVPSEKDAAGFLP